MFFQSYDAIIHFENSISDKTAATTGPTRVFLRAPLTDVFCFLLWLWKTAFCRCYLVSTQLEEADCFWNLKNGNPCNPSAKQSHITRLYLACADVFPQAVLCDGDLQVRVVLPSVPVRGVFPATGPGRQLNTWQEEAKAHRNLELLQGRVATSWGR